MVKSLWENYIRPNSIILTKQMTQNKDNQYATLLENLRTKYILKLDFDVLKTHFLSNLNVNLFDDPWRKTTFIVHHNKLRNAINHYMIDIHSKTSKQKCYIIVPTNTYKKGPICNDIKYIIRQQCSQVKLNV
jgi:hypothetical protein